MNDFLITGFCIAKAPKVFDMITLMDFLPCVYQDMYTHIIANHKTIIDKHTKKKKNKREMKRTMKSLTNYPICVT